jgi:hypothetical protein
MTLDIHFGKNRLYLIDLMHVFPIFKINSVRVHKQERRLDPGRQIFKRSWLCLNLKKSRWTTKSNQSSLSKKRARSVLREIGG